MLLRSDRVPKWSLTCSSRDQQYQSISKQYMYLKSITDGLNSHKRSVVIYNDELQARRHKCNCTRLFDILHKTSSWVEVFKTHLLFGTLLFCLYSTKVIFRGLKDHR